jgi:hypothetical protein
MQATLVNSPRLTLAATLCALLTVALGTSIMPALGGTDTPSIVHQMPSGACPPIC